MTDTITKLKKWATQPDTIAKTLCLVFALGVLWAEIKSQGASIEELQTKFERRIEKSDADHDLLIRIDSNVQSINERVKRIEARP